MSLFGDLPAAQDNKKELKADEDEDVEKLAKRLKMAHDEECAAAHQAELGAGPAAEAQPTDGAEPTASDACGDQVPAALLRIAQHISRPAKFVKASELLRKLLMEGSVQPQHGPLVFEALRAAMVDPRRAAEPTLAREYSKLFTAASKLPELFDPGQRAQLDAFGLWAGVLNQMSTDDSFVFNKALGRIKAMIAELPEATGGEDDAALHQLGLAPLGAQRRQEEQQAVEREGQEGTMLQGAGGSVQAAGPPPETRPERCADSAGAPPEVPRGATWNDEELLAARRAALLDCVCAGREVYRHPWAAVSVDLLVGHARQHATRFAPCQRPLLDGMAAFVLERRAVRKLGPSAKEAARDTTSFDRARAEWGKATLSSRGKVGAGGDRKAEQWLG